MTLLRHRRRIARTLSGARTLRQRMLREWRWFLRDLRDLRTELRLHRGTFAHHRPPGKRFLSVYAFGRSFGFPPCSAYRPGEAYPNQIGFSGQMPGQRAWYLLLWRRRTDGHR